MLGVDAFLAHRMDITLTVDTRPGRQWSVGRELRRGIMVLLDREGIWFVAPGPRRT